MKQYIAMTLGPISRVISFAEKTKELWAASYLFSYLAKQLIQPFRQRKFLLPFLTPEMDRPAVTQGAGVYPDRYIFESCKDDFDKLCKQTDLVLGELATKIAKEIEEDNMLVESYLRRTLKICFFEQSFNETTEDVVAVCEQRLSFLECQDVYPLVEQQNYLQRFFSKVNGSFLVEDGFGKEKKLAGTLGDFFDKELKDDVNIRGYESREYYPIGWPKKTVTMKESDMGNIMNVKARRITCTSYSLYNF